ncbi:hypothetical protein [Tellurirhabdus rosea]|uniref:hypothetical protein n=1 Tax=Tellurirhabdus rosea TaxID=2674997 RepID=UPI00224E6CAE|nr:hypothetical protein [Tellurirhabdus rosea]
MLPFLLIALLSAAAQFFLPWWIIGVIAFAVCYWRSPGGGRAFLNGFLGIAVVWLVYALVQHTQTGGLLTGRMALLIFKTENGWLMLLVTTLVGGLVGGLSGLAGYQVRQVFQPKA